MAYSFIWADPGTDATQDFTFCTSTGGTVSSATDQAHTGPRSAKLSATASPIDAYLSIVGIITNNGALDFWFRRDTNATGVSTIMDLWTATDNVSIRDNGSGKLTHSVGGTNTTGSATIAVNTWYRIAWTWVVTGTTAYEFRVYVDGVLDSTITTGTLASIGFTEVSPVLAAGGTAANTNYWFDDLVTYSGTDLTDPGAGVADALRITNKRPNANGTTNQFTGSGSSSGYGTGNSIYVNQQPLNEAGLVSFVGAGVAKTEEYNVENRSTGDVDITGKTIAGVIGWIKAKSLSSETGKIVVDGTQTNISLTSTSTLFTKVSATPTVFPAGTGTDIGIVTDTTLTTVTMYEGGILCIYNPAAAVASKSLAALGVG